HRDPWTRRNDLSIAGRRAGLQTKPLAIYIVGAATALGTTPQASRGCGSLAFRSIRISGDARFGRRAKIHSLLFAFPLGSLVETSRTVRPSHCAAQNLETERGAPAQPSSSAPWRPCHAGYKLAEIFDAR